MMSVVVALALLLSAGRTPEREGPAKIPAPPAGDMAMEEQADRKRDEEIEQLRKIIPKIPRENSQRADLLFRLAERWYEKSRYVYLLEVREYDQIYARYLDQVQAAQAQAKAKPKEKAAPPQEPRLTTRKSDAFKADAIRLYQQILEEYPRYERNDEVLFNLAYNSYETGNRKEGVDRYWQLIKQHPRSEFIADAYLQMGEHFFTTNDLTRARSAYEKARDSKKPRIYGFAIYKLAWCDFNAGDFDGSLKRFKEVVDHSDQAAQSDKDRIQLKFEALRDMVRVYVALDQVEEADSYWQAKTSRDRARDLTRKLAQAFFDAGRFDRSIRGNRMLLQREPMDPDAPSFQRGVVLAYDKLGKRDEVKREITRLVDLYRPGSEWARANANNKRALTAAYDIGEESMRQIVTDYHAEAQKTKSVATYRAARDIYAKYLEAYAESEQGYNLRYYYADILYSLGEWERAAEQYDKVVEQRPKDGQYLKTAAYNAILGYERLVEVTQGRSKARELSEDSRVDEKKAKGTLKRERRLERHAKGTREQEIPAHELKLIASCDRYVELMPGDKDEIAVRYKAAFAFYDRGHDVEAARRFGEIIVRWPGDPWSRKAADLTLDILNNREQWADLNRLAREFQQNRKLAGGDREFGARLANLVEGSQFQMALAVHEKEKDPKKASAAFRAFVKAFPRSSHADKALQNAVMISEQTGELDQALELSEQLLRDHPSSELVPRAMAQLGPLYERIGDHRKAAEAYERFALACGPAELLDDGGDFPEEELLGSAKRRARGKKPAGIPRVAASKVDAKLLEQVPDQLYDAAFWYEGLGEQQRAATNYVRYLRVYKERKDVPDLFFNLGLMRERQKDGVRAARIFEQFARRFQGSLPGGKIFVARYRAYKNQHPDGIAGARERGELLREYARLSEAERQKVEVADAAGHLAFLEAQAIYDEFVRLKFDNPKTLKRVLGDKLKAMKRVEDAYTGVIQIGSAEYAIAGLVRIGGAYQDFAKNFIDSPDPKGLDAGQLEMYRAELENRAFPLEEKAMEAYEKALAKAYELSAYGPWTLEAQDRLNRFRPGQYAEPRKVPLQGSEPFSSLTTAGAP
jgi:TolA-binding protein